MPDVLGSLQDNDKNSFKIVDDNGVDRVARRVDHPGVIKTQPININREDINLTVTTSGSIAAIDSLGFGSINSSVQVTAISGAGASIQIELQSSDDGVNWTEVSNTRRFFTTGIQRFISLRLSSKFYRYAWTVLGTTPSVTFKVTTTLKPYLPRASVQSNRYGDLTLGTAGNLSSPFSARDTDQVSVMIVRPATPIGTGQIRIQASNNGIDFVDLTGNIGISNGDTILSTFADRAFLIYRVIVATSSGGAAVCDLFWGSNG